jgi:hypothetical protein
VDGAEVQGWIGVDLDGTLAKYDGWRGIEHIGLPIRPMVERVKFWLSKGVKVKIFTARAEHGPEAIQFIKDWLYLIGLPELEVTNVKDLAMIEVWDDRCWRVQANTGELADQKPTIKAI